MIALSLMGCVHTIWFPPDLWVWDSAGDTGSPSTTPPPEPTTGGTPTTSDTAGITELSWGCDPQNERWAWTVKVGQWTSAGTVDLFRVPLEASEQHDLTLIASDPSGAWDQRRAGPLADGVAPQTQVANVDTRYDCEADTTTLSWGVRVRDAHGDLLDCVVGGADPDGAALRMRQLDPDITSLGGCRPPPAP
ncbi:MAG: hypothetical protein ABMA64_01515 [Myxococcota bacterium]